jgi:hypothetical protein
MFQWERRGLVVVVVVVVVFSLKAAEIFLPHDLISITSVPL